STAATDQVFVRRGAEPTDATVALNLRGNTLSSVVHGGRELVRGEDFTVSGDQLTLSAATLSRLTESQEYGVNAVLTLGFSAGAPWDLHVLVHDTPTLADA